MRRRQAHGGTSFEFGAGANANGDGSAFLPDIQSYDYNAPIAEGGEHGYGSDGKDKYEAIQSLLVKDEDPLKTVEPPLPPRTKYSALEFHEYSLFTADSSISALSVGTTTLKELMPREAVGQYYGFILYSLEIDNHASGSSFTLQFVQPPHDRAQIYADNVGWLGAVERQGHDSGTMQNITISTKAPVQEIMILVENMGRIGYGHGMDIDFKGLQAGSVLLDGTVQEQMILNGCFLLSMDHKYMLWVWSSPGCG